MGLKRSLFLCCFPISGMKQTFSCQWSRRFSGSEKYPVLSPLWMSFLLCGRAQVPSSLLLLELSSWKTDLQASYVDQHIAAAGAWNSILGIHPLISPLYPSFFTIVWRTSPIESLLNLSHPHTPWAAEKNKWSLKHWNQMLRIPHNLKNDSFSSVLT